MVRGLDIFKQYFEAYPDNYVIIGGTACDIIIEEAELNPRATKDIDIILVVEALDAAFVGQFWQFIQDGQYERNEKSDDERKYYRFVNPANKEFPQQIELFARNPDLLDFEQGAHLTPIPVDDDLSSLSAILLDDDFYHYMVEHSAEEAGVKRANTEALICLKAKAYLDIKYRIEQGGAEDTKHLKKHRNDVFRLAILLRDTDIFELPERIKETLQAFAQTIEMPGREIFKEMGAGTIDPEKVWQQVIRSFRLEG